MRGDIHEIHLFHGAIRRISFDASGNHRTDKISVGIALYSRVGDLVLLFFQGVKPHRFFPHFPVMNFEVRGFKKSKIIYAREVREIIDEADVRALRRLDRADPSVVGRMDVAHLETRALARQASGAQRRKPAFMLQFRQGIHLVHKLRKLGRGEKFFYNRQDRTEVDELRGDHSLAVVCGHSVLHNTAQAGKPYPEPPLEKLSDRLQSAISQMIDVVRLGFGNIIQPNDLPNDSDEVLLVQKPAVLFHVQIQPLIHFKTPNRGKIIPIEPLEHGIDQILRGLRSRRISGPEAPVDLEIRSGNVLADILFIGRVQKIHTPVINTRACLAYRFIAHAENTQEVRNRHFPVPIDLHADRAIDIRFELKPRAAVRDDLRTEEFLSPPWLRGKIYARGPDDLRNDHALDAVYDKRPPIGHRRKIAEINFLRFAFSRFFIREPHVHAQCGFISRFLEPRGGFIVPRFVEPVIFKIQFQPLPGMVEDRGNFRKNLLEPFFQKPLI